MVVRFFAGVVVAAALAGCGAARGVGSGGECDVIDGTGCPPGEGCYQDRPGRPSYCAPEGTAERGASCEESSDCRSGWHCMRPTGARGLCMKACRKDETDVCVNRSSCVTFGDDFGACSLPCNPITQTGCPPEATCHLLSRGGPSCWGVAGTGTQGSACDTVLSCAPGFTCVDRRTGAYCLQICEPTRPECPDSGTRCSAFGELPYGACRERWSIP